MKLALTVTAMTLFCGSVLAADFQNEFGAGYADDSYQGGTSHINTLDFIHYFEPIQNNAPLGLEEFYGRHGSIQVHTLAGDNADSYTVNAEFLSETSPFVWNLGYDQEFHNEGDIDIQTLSIGAGMYAGPDTRIRLNYERSFIRLTGDPTAHGFGNVISIYTTKVWRLAGGNAVSLTPRVRDYEAKNQLMTPSAVYRYSLFAKFYYGNRLNLALLVYNYADSSRFNLPSGYTLSSDIRITENLFIGIGYHDTNGSDVALDSHGYQANLALQF